MAQDTTITLDQRHPVVDKSGDWGWMSGTCTITTYDTTLEEETDITQHFKTVSRVVTEVSTGCYKIVWNSTSSAFNAYNIQTTLVADTSGDALTYETGALHGTNGGTVDMSAAEASDSESAVGSFNFVVYGTL